MNIQIYIVSYLWPMRKSILGLLLILTTISSYGQDSPSPREESLLEQGSLGQRMVEEMYLDRTIYSKDSSKKAKDLAVEMKEHILSKSLESYQALIDSYPKSKLLYEALINKGLTEFSLGLNAKAKKTFLKVLSSNADESQEDRTGSSSLMDQPTNYKNRAVKVLAVISMADSNYKEAIMYLDKTKQYPYRHFCGNEYAEDAIYMAELYALSYIGLNDTRKAYDYLMPQLIENGLADNSRLVHLAYNTFLKTYQKEDLKKQYEDAFKNYKVEKAHSGDIEYNGYFINFLNTKIELSPWLLDDEVNSGPVPEKIENMYRKSLLYYLLSQ